jgi:hypothetical protein
MCETRASRFVSRIDHTKSRIRPRDHRGGIRLLLVRLLPPPGNDFVVCKGISA